MSDAGIGRSALRMAHARRKYLPLLLPLMLFLALQPLAAEGNIRQWVVDVSVIFVLLATIRVLRTRRYLFVAGVTLFVVELGGMLVVRILHEGTTSSQIQLVNFGAVVILLTATAIHMAIEAVQEEVITLDTVLGAVCVYMLVSLSFSFAYLLLETWTPGAFSGVTAADGSGRILLADLSYYSVVTITTLGYGDIAPVHPFARSLATVEAVFGQFFVAAVIGLLVSRKTSQQP